VWTNVSLGDAMGRWQRNTSEFYPKDQQNAAAGAAGRKDLDSVIGILEEHLAKKKYLLGDAITVSDFHLASFMQWVTMCGVKLDAFPKTAAWMKGCVERPANMGSCRASARELRDGDGELVGGVRGRHEGAEGRRRRCWRDFAGRR
jgi:glutathione S-transferase